MEQGRLVRRGVRVIERDGGAAAEFGQAAQAGAIQQQGAMTLGPKLEQMGLAAAGLTIQRQPAGGPIRRAAEPGARFLIGWSGDEILHPEARDIGEGQGELPRRGVSRGILARGSVAE